MQFFGFPPLSFFQKLQALHHSLTHELISDGQQNVSKHPSVGSFSYLS
jgi:hypothetical protein